MAKRDDKASTGSPGPNNPFGALGKLRDQLPAGPSSPAVRETSTGPARAVVRLERKGRGGKEVTVVSHLERKPAALETWLKALKNGLGCGGQVEGDSIVLQGDQRDRVVPLLESRGVGRVTVG
jgi:translation initiation factor 1